MRYFLTVCLICFVFVVSSGNYLDSLCKTLKTNIPDSSKAVNILVIAEEMAAQNIDTLPLLCKQALKYLKNYGEDKNIRSIKADIYSDLAYYYVFKNLYDSAVYFYTRSTDLYKSVENLEGVAINYNDLGYIYKTLGDWKTAIRYYEKSIEFFQKLNSKEDLAQTFNNLGALYNTIGDIEKASFYYTEALKIYEQTNNLRGMAVVYNSLGYLNENVGNYSEALKYYLKSLEYRNKSGDRRGLSITYNNIAYMYEHQKLHSKALDYYRKAFEIAREIQDLEGVATAYMNLGYIYNQLGNRQKAKQYFFNSRKIYEQIGNYEGLISSLTNISKFYLENNLKDSALYFAKTAYDLAQSYNYLETLIRVYDAYYRALKAANKPAQALQAYEKYIEMRDSLKNIENEKTAFKQQIQYEFEKQKAVREKEFEKQIAVKQQQAEKQKIISYSVSLILILIAIFSALVWNRLKVTQKQKQIIETQKQVVERKNSEILDSINYAKRLQEAILPSQATLQRILPEHFLMFRPKDIVSGDFYWIEEKGDEVFLAVADCTGHGVPGAMVSVVCANALNRIVNEFEITSPAQILDKAREIIIRTFTKQGEKDVKDGMDISLIKFNRKTLQACWSGANNPLWIIRNGQIIEYKPDRQPVGQYVKMQPFNEHEIQLMNGDAFYLFSDGYQDQFGGPKGRKFKAKSIKTILLSHQDKSMREQYQILLRTFEEWKGEGEQTDDVTVIGVRV